MPVNRYAGFLDRTAAVFLDLIIVGTIFCYLFEDIIYTGKLIGPIFFAGTAKTFNEPMMPALVGSVLVGAVLLFLMSWLYSAGVTSSSFEGTFGKMIMGLKVTDYDGRRLSFGKATVRFLAKILSTLILGIGLFLIAFSDRRQGMHDRIAGTYVIYKPKPVLVPQNAGPAIITTQTQTHQINEEESRSNIKKVVLLVSLPFLLLAGMAVLSLILLGAAGSTHTHTNVVALTVQQPDASHIIVTYHGGPDADRLTALEVSINDQPSDLWESPIVEDKKEYTAGTTGKDHVVATGTFRDGTNQVILDTYV